MPETTSPRKPSVTEQVLILVLALYAVSVVGLDTFRPFLHGGQTSSWLLRWYPIAKLGFEADNNGEVISVDKGGPAEAAGLKLHQHIELSSVRPDRRAINVFVYVAHGSSFAMRIIDTPHGPLDVAVPAVDENIDGWSAAALLIAQASAIFFIALCTYLIWHRATWSTWGFFLYGMWFNSGQYFVWYANLPTAGLVVFDVLQAVMQALALTGFLAFALYFPDDEAPVWRFARPLYVLAGVGSVLFVSGALGFCNFVLGWRTEIPYRIYYVFTFVVYFLAAWFFAQNFRRLPNQRSRMRWIVAAGLVGLPCFLLADIYEATNLFHYLPTIDQWIYEHDWVLNLMYASNVILPAAVVYTALHHEVMSVRFAITRAVILSTIFVFSVATLHLVTTLPIETFMEQRQWLRPLAAPLSLLIAVGLALIHSPLHGIVERVCAPRWHRAKRRLEALAQQLVDDDALTVADVDRALVEDTTSALWLQYAALFRRQTDDGFVIQRRFNWPPGAKRKLRGDHPWVRSVIMSPVPLTDPDEAPDEPELAVPVGRADRHPASRLVVYGHHVTRERIDPDEIRIVQAVSRAAALAYMRLDLEAVSDATHGGASTTSLSNRSSGVEGK